MKEINWSDEDVQRVLDMKERGMATDAIAEALGKTPKSIYQMLYRRRRGDVRKRTLFPWGEKDIAELERLLALGHTTREIASAMGRTNAAVATKISMIRVRASIKAEQPEAMQRPIHLPQHTSITAMLCGDPLPGRSALDRRA